MSKVNDSGTGDTPIRWGIDLLDYCGVVWKWRWPILVLVFAAALLSFVISSNLPKIYQATVSMIYFGDANGPTILAVANSKKIKDDIIKQLGLVRYYKVDSAEVARARLKESIRIKFSKHESTVFLRVLDEDPNMAASICNLFVERLSQISESMQFSEDLQTSKDLKIQLVHATEELARVEQEFIKLYRKIKDLVNPSGHIAKTETLKKILAFSRDNTLESTLIYELLEVFSAELAIEYIHIKRELKIHERIYRDLRQKDLELKISKGSGSHSFKVLDKVIPSDKSIKPRIAFNVILASFLVLLVTLSFIFLHEYYRRAWTQRNDRHST